MRLARAAATMTASSLGFDDTRVPALPDESIHR